MTRVGLILPSEAMPRTVFYDRFIEAVRRYPGFTETSDEATIVIPAEETAIETNWPRYGDSDAAYIRGTPEELGPGGALRRYYERIAEYAVNHPKQLVLMLNMHPVVRVLRWFKPHHNIVVADGSLAEFERALNPRTISMPALPIVQPASDAPLGRRPILASFRGAASHPVRGALAQLHDGDRLVVELVEQSRHAGKVDALKGETDRGYEDLIDRSTFSFVPRGDSLFSYRLLEVMARGSIPVILSDGWVLPFDRSVPWARVSVRCHEAAVGELPDVLASFTDADILRLQSAVRRVYAAAFPDLDRIVAALIAEVGHIGPWPPR